MVRVGIKNEGNGLQRYRLYVGGIAKTVLRLFCRLQQIMGTVSRQGAAVAEVLRFFKVLHFFIHHNMCGIIHLLGSIKIPTIAKHSNSDFFIMFLELR